MASNGGLLFLFQLIQRLEKLNQPTIYVTRMFMCQSTALTVKKSGVYHRGKNSDTLDEISVRQTVALFFNQWQNRTKMWSTTVEKDDIRANFYVDTKDTKYYFKDRDKSFTENGATKKDYSFC
jgi:hypothetical protein